MEADGTAALAAARRLRPVAIVLDIALPGMDGVTVCRRLREGDDWTPVVFVTARDEVADRILGLELGADDYLTKRFSPHELVARVKSVLRRTAGPGQDSVRRVGRLTLDTSRRTLHVDGDTPLDRYAPGRRVQGQLAPLAHAPLTSGEEGQVQREAGGRAMSRSHPSPPRRGRGRPGSSGLRQHRLHHPPRGLRMQ